MPTYVGGFLGRESGLDLQDIFPKTCLSLYEKRTGFCCLSKVYLFDFLMRFTSIPILSRKIFHPTKFLPNRPFEKWHLVYITDLFHACMCEIGFASISHGMSQCRIVDVNSFLLS